MKRIFSMIAALALAVLMTACANTATGPDMAPGYDNTYGNYGTSYGYGSTGNGYRGNVSTTNDGRVNGTNRTARTDRTGRTSTRPVTRTNAGSNVNTDAMGAGMRG